MIKKNLQNNSNKLLKNEEKNWNFSKTENKEFEIFLNKCFFLDKFIFLILKI